MQRQTPTILTQQISQITTKIQQARMSGCQGVFQRPENIGMTVEYLNPSFLVTKPSRRHRLVTAFADMGRYAKPQLSLMPNVDSTLRSIAKWKYLIVTDLTSAFYQIPLSKSSVKYCGVATPFQGVLAYTHCAMGMPGSETALEELMYHVLGDCIEDGIAAKLADDLYCGADSPEDLHNWQCILKPFRSVIFIFLLARPSSAPVPPPY